MVTAGAASVYPTARDMARYVAALLGGGANVHGSVLKPATLATMFEPHYQPDPRVPGMGLGFWRATPAGTSSSTRGSSLASTRRIFMAPDDGVGVMAFTNGASRAMLWLAGELAGLLNHLLGVPDEAIRTDVPQHPKIWGDICGWYHLPCRLADVPASSMVGAGVEVFARRGQLILRALSPVPAVYRGFPLHPDDDKDPYVFRIDLSEFGIGTGRVILSRKPGAGTTAVHLDLLPLSLQKRPNVRNPRPWVNARSYCATATTPCQESDGLSATGPMAAGCPEASSTLTSGACRIELCTVQCSTTASSATRWRSASMGRPSSRRLIASTRAGRPPDMVASQCTRSPNRLVHRQAVPAYLDLVGVPVQVRGSQPDGLHLPGSRTAGRALAHLTVPHGGGRGPFMASLPPAPAPGQGHRSPSAPAVWPMRG